LKLVLQIVAEIFFGIKIILARLVNHVELMMLGGGLVDDDLVQLS